MERKSIKYEVISEETHKFGKNNFLEVARKTATPEGGETNKFINIARGWFGPDGNKRYKNTVAIPDDADVKKFISEQLLKI